MENENQNYTDSTCIRQEKDENNSFGKNLNSALAQKWFQQYGVGSTSFWAGDFIYLFFDPVFLLRLVTKFLFPAVTQLTIQTEVKDKLTVEM